MQDCFRQYPEVYGAELEDDEPEAPNAGSEQPLASQDDASTTPEEKHEHAKETDEVVPKAWHESEVEKAPEQQTEK
jgi:intermembrane space import and assembly protein 40